MTVKATSRVQPSFKLHLASLFAPGLGACGVKVALMLRLTTDLHALRASASPCKTCLHLTRKMVPR
jgi:hypothetical protein